MYWRDVMEAIRVQQNSTNRKWSHLSGFIYCRLFPLSLAQKHCSLGELGGFSILEPNCTLDFTFLVLCNLLLLFLSVASYSFPFKNLSSSKSILFSKKWNTPIHFPRHLFAYLVLQYRITKNNFNIGTIRTRIVRIEDTFADQLTSTKAQASDDSFLFQDDHVHGPVLAIPSRREAALSGVQQGPRTSPHPHGRLQTLSSQWPQILI